MSKLGYNPTSNYMEICPTASTLGLHAPLLGTNRSLYVIPTVGRNPCEEIIVLITAGSAIN